MKKLPFIVIIALLAAFCVFFLVSCAGSDNAGSSYADGVYEGRSNDHQADEDGVGSGYGVVSLEIKNNKITSATVTKINGKKLNLKKNYKLYIAAYKLVDGNKVRLANTIVGHVVGRKNTKYTNTKKVKLKKSSYALKVKKTAVIKAEAVPEDKSKKLLSDSHVADFRYASSNKKVATVSSKGVVKGVKAGTAKITVTAADGSGKKATVTVKVVKKAVANKVLKLKKSAVTLKKKGATAQITIKALTKGTTDTVTYSLTKAGKKLISVDKYGVVTVKAKPTKKAQKAVVTVKCGKKSAKYTVTIKK